MSLPIISESQFAQLLMAGVPIIDVRAPIEFREGSIPGSINLPILSDEERALVGTKYKQAGQDAAIELGLKLVSNEIKSARLNGWIQFITTNPNAVLTCFRGGLRSKTAQRWLSESKCEIPRIEGGYKKFRQFLMDHIESFCRTENLHVISGATGSGKTLLLRSLKTQRRVCDLEKHANHRGSSFGGYPNGQPTQIDFENQLSLELLQLNLKNDGREVLIEDESRLIGKSVQPACLFELLRSSSIILIDEDLSSRTQVTFEDYILGSPINSDNEKEALQFFESYKISLQNISKKLGGLRTTEVLADLERSRQDYLLGRGIEENRIWIEKLLKYYYDPMYQSSLQKRNPKIIFQGSRKNCSDFLLAPSI